MIRLTLFGPWRARLRDYLLARHFKRIQQDRPNVLGNKKKTVELSFGG